MSKYRQAKIEGYDISRLLEAASKAVSSKTADSIVMDQAAEDRIPKFGLQELNIGKVLGRGGFCVVREITEIRLAEEHLPKQETKEDDEDLIHNIVQNRGFMATHFLRQGKDYRYAIKSVKEAAKESAQLYVNAIVDLAIEARFLAVIRHPNIIKMRAMAVTPPCDGSFFIILDKLYDTLTVRLKIWKKRMRKGVFGRIICSRKKELEFWGERLTVGYDLSCALGHLHDMHIIYRDIKPDNIGFDVRGDVKIFDFGLAKEFQNKDRGRDGTFKLTAETGSPRYMAPEVFMGKQYNETCDVYSFCILLWQILTTEIPYEDYTENMLLKNVCKKGARPRCDPTWSNEVNECLRCGWTGEVAKRMSMEQVSEKLRLIIMQETNEEIEDFVGCSRKSEMSV
ncbi:hypothetical protein ACA910_019675 [Epithemia clementina (nom. ined.)]